MILSSGHDSHEGMTHPPVTAPRSDVNDGGHADHRGHEGHQAPEKHQGHDQHAGHSVEMFRDKFWWSVALTVPTVVWSPMVQQWLHFQAPTFPGSRYIPAIFGTILFFYGGMVFLKGAVREIKDRLPGMMTLISLAIVVAFGFSIAVTLGVPGMDLWWELSTLITIMILGHWIEMRSISQAQGALKELAKLVPDTAVRLVGDKPEEVAVSELRPAFAGAPPLRRRRFAAHSVPRSEPSASPVQSGQGWSRTIPSLQFHFCKPAIVQ